MERLLFLHNVFTRITEHDSADIARTWLLGSNPGLGEDGKSEQRIIAIRNGKLREVDAAFIRFINDIYD